MQKGSLIYQTPFYFAPKISVNLRQSNTLPVKVHPAAICIICLILILACTIQAFGQPYTCTIEIKNQPENKILLGAVQGDDFLVIDSIEAPQGIATFTFDNKNHKGVYRINLGLTPYARLMNKAPQTFDFIFNYENIHIATHFKYPTDSLVVLQSSENKLWYEVLKKKQDFEQAFYLLEKEVDHFWSIKDSVRAFEKSNEFNRLQMGHDIYLAQKTQQNKELLVSKIIATYRQPIMDGFLSPEERKETFQTECFKTVDFTHEELIKSSAYSDKIFEYLITFNDPAFTKDQRIVAYKKALDQALPQINQNQQVYRFIKSYLFYGFESLGMPEIIGYIRNNYD